MIFHKKRLLTSSYNQTESARKAAGKNIFYLQIACKNVVFGARNNEVSYVFETHSFVRRAIWGLQGLLMGFRHKIQVENIIQSLQTVTGTWHQIRVQYSTTNNYNCRAGLCSVGIRSRRFKLNGLIIKR